MNADDIEYAEDPNIGSNLFTYCKNEPVSMKDPSGTISLSSVRSILSKVSNFIAYVVSWLSLSGKVKSRVVNIIAIASIVLAAWQYYADYKAYYNKSKRLFKIATASFALCVISNVITILLSRFSWSKCRSCIKSFLWFLGTSFGLAIGAYYWVYDLAFATKASYKWLKTRVKNHY